LKLWLSEGNFYVNNKPPDLSLFCQSIDDVRKCLSLDAFRFASHAAQTVYELEKGSAYQKLTSWRVIQTYYAAYYSAHSILRFFGRSFSHLEAGHVNFLKGRCNSEAGYTPNLPSSYYLISLSPPGKNLEFQKCSESHKDLWRCFHNFLIETSSEVLSLRASEERKQTFSQKFTELAEVLTNRGRTPVGNWLSVVRNDVNYKSLHGVWFPFNGNTPSFETLMRQVREWRTCTSELENPNTIRNDMERFFFTAFSIVDFCLSIAFDYRKHSAKPGRRSSDFSRLIYTSAAA
jgi:hypothetical protein